MKRADKDRHEHPTDPLDETAAAALDGISETATDARVDQLERERDELKDLLLRKTAEFDNYRKRTERDRQVLSDAITASVLEDLLPLMDDLDRALEVEAGGDTEAYRQGVELIQRQLADLLRKRGVEPIESLGADFDPNYHQAVVYEPAEGRREGEIFEEFRRGYMLGDRLLRPSMVKVAKG
jgi:molecular chaperone GrpE